jgi:hypothetical protein
VAAEEKLPKPITPGGAGEPVDGLRTSVVMVKSDFGPGESLMAIWKITNESAKPVVINLGKNHVYDFTLEARRDGKDLALARVDFKDFHSPQTTLEPGESITRGIDLRAIHIQQAQWCDPLGGYEARLNFGPKNIKSAWVKFRVTGAGEQMPRISPELAEKIDSLIRQLGDDVFAKRESAHKELLAIGPPALPLVSQAANAAGGDPEIVARCKRLIGEIRNRQAPPVVQPQPKPVPGPIIDPPPGDF